MFPRLFSRATRSLVRSNIRTFFNGNSGFDPKKDYYSILGVDKKATEREIKDAFYSLAKKYHPDSQKGFEDKFKEINEANSVLGDDKVRKQYDEARTFGDFRKKFTRGSRAQQAQQQEFAYNFRDVNWRNEFNNLNKEEQAQVRNQLQALIRRLALMSVGFVFVMYIFFRKPARQYAIGPDGSLTPIYQPLMGPPMYPSPYDQFGNAAPGMYNTPNSNPFHQNAQYNQYSPYSPYHTQNPNQHPYSR